MICVFVLGVRGAVRATFPCRPSTFVEKRNILAKNGLRHAFIYHVRCLYVLYYLLNLQLHFHLDETYIVEGALLVCGLGVDPLGLWVLGGRGECTTTAVI